MEPLGLTIGQWAEDLGVFRQTMVKVVNGKSDTSHEMTIRPPQAVDTTDEF